MSIVAYRLDAKNNHLCLIIGLGLIGSNIERELSYYADPLEKNALLLNQWRDAGQIHQYLKLIVDQYKPTTIDFIWSAGKTGFDAEEDAISAEYKFFENFLDGLELFSNTRFIVNLISSAGGVYEGTNGGMICSIDNISALGSYGMGKLRQEAHLQNLSCGHRIYRASSVYGIRTEKMRMGLLNILIRNSKAGLSTNIYANQNTLRDYIFCTDVARHTVKNIVGCSTSRLEVLASGRPASINMIVNIVARVTNQKVLINYQPGAFNTKDIVFAPSVIPNNLSVTTMEEGISLLNQFT